MTFPKISNVVSRIRSAAGTICSSVVVLVSYCALLPAAALVSLLCALRLLTNSALLKIKTSAMSLWKKVSEGPAKD